MLVVSVRCGKELTHCARLYMLYEWEFCSLPVGCREVHLPATETGPKLCEKFKNFQTVKNAMNSNFSSSKCYGEDEGDRSPCDSE